jgi:hypothetical protein
MSMGNWNKRLISYNAGCFFCGGIYPADDVREHIEEEDGSKTAICPYCDIDAVIFDVDIKFDDAMLNDLRQKYYHPSVDD